MTGEKATHQEKELHATSQPVSRETKIYKGQDRQKLGEDRTDFGHCVFVYRAFKTGKDLQEIQCYTSRHDSKRIDS